MPIGWKLGRHSRPRTQLDGVLERPLQDRDWIVDDYSIADMLAFPWAFVAKPLGASLDAYPRVAAWRQRLKSRPAVRRAIDLYKSDQ